MQSLETETEILQDRDETWDLRDRDRDSKKRVSRHVSRPRPSLKTPSLVLSKHYTTVWWSTSRFMVAGTSYTHRSQLFSKKNLRNEKVAKVPKSIQI